MIALFDDLMHGYLAECGEHLVMMEESLLALEQGGTEIDERLVSRARKAAHSIKGGAAVFHLAKVVELADRTESALALLGAHRMIPTPNRVSVLLRATDILRALLDDPGAGKGADIAAILAAIDGLSASGPAAPEPRRGPDWRLRALLVEDDFTSRLLMQTFLSRYGECHVAVNGREAVEAVRAALDHGQIYDLICMDIMMPEMDGSEAVRRIRALEEARGILSTRGAKIVMTTAVKELKEVMHCFRDLCDAYLVKPIDLSQLTEQMKSYRLVK